METETKCSRCRLEFDSHAAMVYHRTKIHIKGSRLKFECHLCNKSLKSRQAIRDHITLKHTGLKPFKCSKCLDTFAAKSYLRVHTMTKHGPFVDFQCTLCPKKYSHKSTLTAHVTKRHDNIYYCYLCQKYLSDKPGLEQHMDLLHTRQSLTMLPCPFPHCSATFADDGNLKRHINVIHTRQITFKCIRCPERFYCKIELTNHLANKHGHGDLTTQLQISTAKESLAVENIRFTPTWICFTLTNLSSIISFQIGHKHLQQHTNPVYNKERELPTIGLEKISSTTAMGSISFFIQCSAHNF